MSVSPILATMEASARYVCTLPDLSSSLTYCPAYAMHCLLQDAIGSYLCNCVNGFSGRNCDGKLITLNLAMCWHITSNTFFMLHTENPAAVSFAAVIGGGAVGLFLLILIALVLLVILIWVARQLKKERAIATAG